MSRAGPQASTRLQILPPYRRLDEGYAMLHLRLDDHCLAISPARGGSSVYRTLPARACSSPQMPAFVEWEACSFAGSVSGVKDVCYAHSMHRSGQPASGPGMPAVSHAPGGTSLVGPTAIKGRRMDCRAFGAARTQNDNYDKAYYSGLMAIGRDSQERRHLHS